jgi:hypothetical protein
VSDAGPAGRGPGPDLENINVRDEGNVDESDDNHSFD